MCAVLCARRRGDCWRKHITFQWSFFFYSHMYAMHYENKKGFCAVSFYIMIYIFLTQFNHIIKSLCVDEIKIYNFLLTYMRVLARTKVDDAFVDECISRVVVFASDAHLRPLCVCDFIFRIDGDTCKILIKENNDRTRMHMNSIVFTWMFNYYFRLLPPHVPRNSWIFVMYNLHIYFDLENVIWIFMCKVLYSWFFFTLLLFVNDETTTTRRVSIHHGNEYKKYILYESFVIIM